MRWEDERYVRLYTRDSATWLLLPWQSRFVLMSLLRKVDRAGILELGDGDRFEELAAVIMVPPEVLEMGLKPLLERGVAERRGPDLVLPKFLEAQEAAASDKERQRKSRELARIRHEPSQPVTSGHDMSQPVTPSRAVPSRAVPSRAVPCLPAPITKPNDDAIEALRLVWNAETRPPVPTWKQTGALRRKAAKAALERRQLDGPGGWTEVFRALMASPLCRGEVEGGWIADIDWALRPEGRKPEPAAKLLEGGYARGKKPIDITKGRVGVEHSYPPQPGKMQDQGFEF